MLRLVLSFAMMGVIAIASAAASDTAALSIDASKSGAKIDRNLFGQFAEHLGQGVYEGVWVGSDSPIPNTRGIRNDVVAALKGLKVPNVRWPGGCFADEYHWRRGVGRQRAVTLNPNWGGVTESNAFGTHEFMDFVDQIGAEAYVSVNVGSGTPQEAAEWLEYLTAAQPTTLAKERATNGHPAPCEVAYLGIGNESWDCGGNMTPEFYLSQLKAYSRFVRNFNPAQQPDPQRMLKIAVGPGGDGPRWTEWTDTVMKAWQSRSWSWDFDGLSMHNYTVVKWPPSYKSTGFGEAEYAQILTLPRLGAIAARDKAGTLWLAVTNLDPDRPVTVEARLAGLTPRSAAGETLTAPAVDSVNTFGAPGTVVPKPIAATIRGATLALALEPRSVTVISVEQ